MSEEPLTKDFQGRVPEIHQFRDISFLPSEIECEDDRTFHSDEQLPPLPLPSLRNSLDLYLQSVRAVVTDKKQYSETEKIVREFEKNEGTLLQEMLRLKAEKEKNWIERFWYENAYLRWRSPLIPYSNMGGPGGCHRHFWPPLPADTEWCEKRRVQTERLALYVTYMLHVWLALRRELLPPNTRRATSDTSAPQKLEMSQFRRTFNTCRIPQPECDTFVNYFRTQREGACPRHVTVACRGYYYYFPVIYDNAEGHEAIVPAKAIHDALQEIALESERRAAWAGDGVGALSTQDRDTWAHCRRHLLGLDTVHNAHTLDIMQSSILHAILGDSGPVDGDDMVLHCMSLEPQNAWADKAHCLYATSSGVMIASVDHSPIDGMVLALIGVYGDQQAYITRGQMPPMGPEELPSGVLPLKWRPVEFKVDDFIRDHSLRAVRDHGARCSALEAKEFFFLGYGRKKIRSAWRQHPDTVCQAALHLTYFRVHGKPAPTYETASTRGFYHGRTETLRSCTPQMVRWCHSMLDWLQSGDVANAWGPRTQKCAQDYQAAAEEHNRLRNLCENGNGLDRHLFALQLLWRGLHEHPGGPAPHPLLRNYPALFSDPSWRLTGGDAQFVLSTSFGGYFTTLGAVPPMVQHGYGAFYRVGPDRVHFNLIAFKGGETSVEKMATALYQSFEDLEKLLDAAADAMKRKQQNETSISAKL